MKTFLANLRNVAISGFFFLLPIIVMFIIITKAWSALTSIGTRIAGIFGVSSILGFKGGHIFTGLLMLAICIVCGLLVHISFVAGFHKTVEGWMSKHIPGYDAYRVMAEEKAPKQDTYTALCQCVGQTARMLVAGIHYRARS
jgi:hypothetical protein